jgi:hypothetical protein
MPILGVVASQISGHLAPPITGSYDALAVYTLAGDASSITFAGIPQSGYQHLQIRGIARTDRSGFSNDGAKVQFNNDTGSNYAMHQIYGDGSAVSANSLASTNVQQVAFATGAGAIANNFGGFIIDILDYTNTNKYKTLRAIGGQDNNTSSPDTEYGWVGFTSILWMNTNAINTITLSPRVGSNFKQYTQFALYGIRG